jgi:transposase
VGFDLLFRVQSGERIAAFVLYLLHYQLLPEKRLATLMADLFGVKPHRDHRQDQPGLCRTLPALRRCITRPAAPVKHMDETGCGFGGKTQWLHIASTVWLTFYRTAAKRGSLLANVTGIVVHDHWKPYYLDVAPQPEKIDEK